MNRLKQWWGGPDPALIDAGAGGELVVANIRLLVLNLLLLIPLYSAIRAPSGQEYVVGLVATLIAVLAAIGIRVVVRRGFYRPWLGFATTALDVSLVSVALVGYLLLNRPHMAVNSLVIFEVYFLAIGATSIRYDLRVCAFSGALAAGQYGLIAFYADSRWDLNGPAYAPFLDGQFDWPTQWGRILMLVAAAVLSMAIVGRVRRLRRLSARDRLTGLLNRGYFEHRLEAEISRAVRYKHQISLAMVDVDRFKRFNDSFGHAAGDIALREIAATILRSVRESDIVTRYGGEEFVLVFPETRPEDAVEKLEHLRLEIAQTLVRIPQHEATAGFTVSAGVASFPADGDGGDDLLDQADRRLFQAKEAGRNKVVGPPNLAVGTAREATVPEEHFAV
ncbi:MAG: GGDEF domain-containing protein [Gemmatimonadales bacterium]|nr:GGDEF domain-containing protein [Gemmatimonadales bacterium]